MKLIFYLNFFFRKLSTEKFMSKKKKNLSKVIGLQIFIVKILPTSNGITALAEFI